MQFRTFFSLASLVLLAASASAADPQGVLPRGADGKELNLDFETGDLRDWLAEGAAFRGQPIKGDTVFPRRKDMRSGHAGDYWIGGFERDGDKPQGTLTSAPFKVTHPYAAFLVGGGPHPTTCVEVVLRDPQKVIYSASGRENELMTRAVVDLQPYQGKEIFVRVVDKHTGHWGHVNFDDFRFYDKKPEFATPAGPKRVVDIYAHAGLSPEEAAKAMTLPKDFRVIASAGEPDVRQPIAMTIDDRGRVWVAEAYSYPVRVPDAQAKDRILIFEDTDGDGKFDKRKVFAEKLNLVSGLELGFGGVWVGAAPQLLFIPDRDNDDTPDGPPEVVLDGWGYQDTHETLNSFIWGPDGWLYGCHGVFTHSRVGKPGTPDSERTPINAGIWRYHPVQKKFEVFAYGTSNPWGVDFNDNGHCFLTCCVIPHLFHMIQGARYQRQGGQHFQQYTYADIQTIAKHRHWTGNQWNDADRARSDSIGGGHAHAGAMLYLGDAWPAEFRGKLFMNNIHGARLNQDSLTARGSGYEGDGDPDFCKTNDLWSQIIYLRYGPDGQAYMIDWYDRNQCHHRDVNGHDRSNGRVFKIVYGEPKQVTVDMKKKSDLELAEYQLHANDWYVRQARRLLHERSTAGKIDPKARQLLTQTAFTHADVTRRLRGLWALHVTGGLSPEQVLKGLADESPLVRSWTVQLACETGTPDAAALSRFVDLAKTDASPVVRLYLASACQRLPVEVKTDVLAGLLSHADDAADHNLPLMYWYAAEPLAEVDPLRALRLAGASKIPLVRTFMIRRVGTGAKPELLDLLVKQLAATEDATLQREFLAGLRAALVGKRQVAMPPSWKDVFARLGDSAEADIRTGVWALAVTFGDPTVFEKMRTRLTEKNTPADQRKEFLASLLAARDPQLAPVLRRLVDDPALRAEAIRGLASYDVADTPEVLLALYPKLNAAERRDALATLSSRAPYAKQLLAAVGAKKLPATDLTADLVRQMRNLKDAEINKQIAAVWGIARETAADKAKLIATWKTKLARIPTEEYELAHGRAVFAKTCQQCHTLFGAGGKVGPELTGSNRADLDYLLSNVLDPSAVMAKEYLSTVIETKQGRVITGIVKEQTKDALTVVTANETVVVPRDEIAEMAASNQSMMPDDLLKPLSDRDVRALVAYLASPRQTPQLATTESAATFFNGRDLTGWQGDPRLWRVENGEIVGTSPGLKHNTFLVSDLLAGDFRLTLQVKLTPNKENSGIQFRSVPLPDGEMRGYQADAGAGWWGKLYEERGRALLWKESGEAHVKVDDWNQYEIIAEGSHIRTFINGKPCVDLDDPPGARQGVFALQIHSGGPMEVRFKDLKLELK